MVNPAIPDEIGFSLANKVRSCDCFFMNCVFCAIAAGEAPGFILWEDQHVFVILSLEGHPLVIPRRHFPSLDGLDDATGAVMMLAAKKVALALRSEMSCEGVNLVLSDGAAAGQDVFHLHLHVKPRWTGDDVVLHWDASSAPSTKRSNLATRLTARLANLSG